MAKVQQVAPKDYMTSFGSATLAAGDAAAENILNLNKADASRMQVKVQVTTAAAGGTSVVFKVKGSNDNSSYEDVVVSPSIPVAKLTEGANFALAIPDGYNAKYLKFVATGTGAFSAGKVEAAVDAYMGL